MALAWPSLGTAADDFTGEIMVLLGWFQRRLVPPRLRSVPPITQLVAAGDCDVEARATWIAMGHPGRAVPSLLEPVGLVPSSRYQT
jgi:hypothetical protein